jgi:Bacterial Ig-like domain (group 3)
VFPLDNADGSVDTNAFNSDVMVLPLATSALTAMSKKAKSGNITYWVAAGTIESGLTDVTKKASFNVLKPGLAVVHGPSTVGPTAAAFGGEQFFADLGKSAHVAPLTVLREPTYAAQHGKGLLLVHSDNVTGDRVQVVPIAKVATSVKTSVTATATPIVAGSWVTLTAKVSSKHAGIGAPQGTVTFYDNGKAVIKRAVDHLGVVRFVTRLTKGVHVIGARYSGNALDWLTSKSTLRITVP